MTEIAGHYIDNGKFESLIQLYQETEDESVRDTLIKDYFYVLAYRIVKSFKFRHVDDDDALQEAVIICFKRIAHFDPARGKAFNFFTTLIVNQLKGLYRKNKNHRDFLWQMRKQQAIENLSTLGGQLSRQIIDCVQGYEMFVHDFDINENSVSDAWEEAVSEDVDLDLSNEEVVTTTTKKRSQKMERQAEAVAEDGLQFPSGMSKVQFCEIWERLKEKSPAHRTVLEALEVGEEGVMTGRGRINKAALISKLQVSARDVTAILEDARTELGDKEIPPWPTN